MRLPMIPLWIIIEEENRRIREESESQRPTLEIPMYPPAGYVDWNSYPEGREDSEVQRGEVTIPLW